VCTIGSASNSPEVLKAMVEAGMDIARLNLSHGDEVGHRRVIASLREVGGVAILFLRAL
jgi:pyruvate kinase